MAHTIPVVNLPFVVVPPPLPFPGLVPADVGEGALQIPTVDALDIGSHLRKVDTTNPAMLYQGFAPLGSVESEAVWQIYRIDLAAGYQWMVAVGTWIDRATLEYA